MKIGNCSTHSAVPLNSVGMTCRPPLALSPVRASIDTAEALDDDAFDPVRDEPAGAESNSRSWSSKEFAGAAGREPT